MSEPCSWNGVSPVGCANGLLFAYAERRPEALPRHARPLDGGSAWARVQTTKPFAHLTGLTL